MDTLQWRHNECDSVSNHQPVDCLSNCLFRRTSRKTSKLRVTGLCAGIHRDRWIPRTKGQLRGKCFHLMTSSWYLSISPMIFRIVYASLESTWTDYTSTQNKNCLRLDGIGNTSSEELQNCSLWKTLYTLLNACNLWNFMTPTKPKRTSSPCNVYRHRQ